VPAALALVALAALVLALARPHRTTHVAVEQAAVVLVLDHSGSMDSTDVSPTRLQAAENAANTFISELPSAARVGVVSFSTAPDAVQAPTTDHSAASQVIDGQTAGGSTATGDALQVALGLLHQGPKPPPASIVLLSDGAANAGLDPIAVAHQAAQDKIPIDTVALGTPNGVLANPDPYAPPLPVPPDPELMAQIAQASGGRVFDAQDENQLSSIYRHLGSQLASKPVRKEITADFAIGGLVLLLAAAVASTRFSPRLP
jgi:Ca-activated chloride channel family protein